MRGFCLTCYSCTYSSTMPGGIEDLVHASEYLISTGDPMAAPEFGDMNERDIKFALWMIKRLSVDIQRSGDVTEYVERMANTIERFANMLMETMGIRQEDLQK